MIEDRSVCTFYLKIGACRHGEKCSRKHIQPHELKTVLLANLYPNPKTDRNSDISVSDNTSAEAFEHFYIDVYKRLAQAGEIDSMLVCENENFHLSGNVYVKYTSTSAALQAVMLINQEWFAGKPVYCELSPVQSFHEAKCRSHDTNTCNRGDHCNFMHVKKVRSELVRKLRLAQEKSLALRKLRELFGDEKWGEEWEKGTKEKYLRDRKKRKVEKVEVDKIAADEDVKKNEKEAIGEKETAKAENVDEKEKTKSTGHEPEEESEDEPVSTTEAVARLFA